MSSQEQNHGPQGPIVWGIPQRELSEAGGAYATATIAYWLAAGLIYNFFAGNLVSLSSALLLFPGIFVISIVSIPLFYLKIKKVQAIQAMNARDGIAVLTGGKKANPVKDVPQLMFYTLSSVLDFLFPIVAAVLAMHLLNN